MFFRKTVWKTLKGTGWDKFCETNENFKLFMARFGHSKCRFLSKSFDEEITYADLYKKSKEGTVHVFQNGNFMFFADMDPFEFGLCICTKKTSSVVELFLYDAPVFKRTMVIQDSFLLLHQLENFHIFKTDGSRVEKLEDFPNYEELLAISKKSFFQTNCHIVIRYIPYGLFCS